jgi:hypothetical protein
LLPFSTIVTNSFSEAAAIKLMSLLGMLSVRFSGVLHCVKDVLTAGEVVTMLALLVSDTAAGVADNW